MTKTWEVTEVDGQVDLEPRYGFEVTYLQCIAAAQDASLVVKAVY